MSMALQTDAGAKIILPASIRGLVDAAGEALAMEAPSVRSLPAALWRAGIGVMHLWLRPTCDFSPLGLLQPEWEPRFGGYMVKEVAERVWTP